VRVALDTKRRRRQRCFGWERPRRLIEFAGDADPRTLCTYQEIPIPTPPSACSASAAEQNCYATEKAFVRKLSPSRRRELKARAHALDRSC